MARLMFNGTRLRFGHDRLCQDGPRHGHKTQLNRIFMGKSSSSQTAIPIIPNSSISDHFRKICLLECSPVGSNF
jgi:hypothetical protein